MYNFTQTGGIDRDKKSVCTSNRTQKYSDQQEILIATKVIAEQAALTTADSFERTAETLDQLQNLFTKRITGEYCKSALFLYIEQVLFHTKPRNA